MKEKPPADQHSPGKSLLLHLFPGVLIAAGYLALVRPLQRLGFPSMMALMLATAFILVPVELGYLLVHGKHKNGHLSLNGILSYQYSLPLLQYYLWAPILLFLWGWSSAFFQSVEKLLLGTYFATWPVVQTGLNGEYARTPLLITYGFAAIFGALIGPVVEELYFRGYLLPRMGFAGKWTPILHSFLYAAYHFYAPWTIFTRTVAILPTAYAVRQKNLKLGIAVHILASSIEVIVGIAFVAKMF